MRALLLAISTLFAVIAVTLTIALSVTWRRARRGAPLSLAAAAVLTPVVLASLGVALAVRPLRLLAT